MLKMTTLADIKDKHKKEIEALKNSYKSKV